MKPTDSFEFIRSFQLAKMLSISESTLRRMRQRKEIPAPIYLTSGIVVWEKQAISDWIKEIRNKHH
jgi:predicted DNA-binding transcriptional regulator AlpA